MTNRDGAAKNLSLMRVELRAVREGWRFIRADQSGWTHQYMQDCRTLVRRGTVISATLLGLGMPALAVAALIGWIL